MIHSHDPHDADKVAAIAASLARDGWQGAPLVVWDDILITGNHRYAAARALDWIDADIPTIDLADVFAEAGLDFAALLQQEGIAGFDHPELPWFLGHYLPEEVIARYQIDMR